MPKDKVRGKAKEKANSRRRQTLKGKARAKEKKTPKDRKNLRS